MSFKLQWHTCGCKIGTTRLNLRLNLVQVASIGNNITVQIAASISAKVGTAVLCLQKSVSAVHLEIVQHMLDPYRYEAEEAQVPHQVAAAPSCH